MGKVSMLTPTDFFDLEEPFTAKFFEECKFVWDILPKLAAHVASLTDGQQTILGEVMDGATISDRPIYIGEGARIEPGAYVHGPAYIAAGAGVRHGVCGWRSGAHLTDNGPADKGVARQAGGDVAGRAFFAASYR